MKNQLICITHPEKNKIKHVEFSAGICKIKDNLFAFVPENTTGTVAIVLEAEKLLSFNQIRLRIESTYNLKLSTSLFFSEDKLSWSRILIKEEVQNQNELIYILPLSSAKYWQIVISAGDNSVDSWKSIKKIEGAIEAFFPIKYKSSGTPDRLWLPENLTDLREDYGWESNSPETERNDFVELDFKYNYYISSIALKSIKEVNNRFPNNFLVMVSKDGHNWDAVVTEDNCLVASGCIYRWNFEPVFARFIKIVINKPIQSKNYKCKILELYTYAYPDNIFVEVEKSWFSSSKYASELVPGAVKLATFNESSPLKAIQSNDPRLKYTTSEYPGIVQLSRDNDTQSGMAVQANDSRLKKATTENPGIIQLAKDEDTTPGKVVQANDSRLKKATTENPGLVRLAKDGDTTPNLVVQANDSRLKKATTENPGIIQLAKDEDTTPGKVVQANDSRLKKATTAWAGISQLANHNEVAPNKIVQADDPRLKDGTEEIKGIIRFAKNRENIAFKAVQANDERLQYASTDKDGTVRFAKPGVNTDLLAVQANDPRLNDSRTPLAHTHDYAPQNHSLNSHQGSLNIKINKEILPGPSYEQPNAEIFPFSVTNEQGLVASFEGGIIAKAENAPALLATSKTKPAIEGRSKEVPAGIFISETKHALILPQNLNAIKGSGKSLLAEGEALFAGNVIFQSGQTIAVSFNNYSNESFANGDVLTIKPDGKVYKLSSPLDVCIGVYTNQNQFVLMDKKANLKCIYIGITGILNIRVKGKVIAGDLLGFVNNTPGVIQKIHSNQKDYIIAIALENSDTESEKIIKCILKK